MSRGHRRVIGGPAEGSGHPMILVLKALISPCALLLCGYLQALSGGLFLIPSFKDKFLPYLGVQSAEDTYCKFNNRLPILYVTSLHVLGLISSQVSAYFTRRYGHTALILRGAVLVAGGALLGICSIYWGWAMLLPSRSVQGLGLGFLIQAAVSELTEMAPANRSGRFVCAGQLWIRIGALLGTFTNLLIIGYGEHLGDYGWMISSSVVPLVLAFTLMAACIWLQDLTKDASHVLETDNAGADMKGATSLFRSLPLLREKKHRDPVLTGIAIQMFTLLGAIMIGPITYQAIGFNPKITLRIESIRLLVGCIGTGVMTFYVDKLQDRVEWLTCGSCIMSVLLGVLWIVVQIMALKGGYSQGYYMVIFALYEIGFAPSWGSQGVVFVSEIIYPLEIQSLGRGMVASTSFILSALISGLTPFLLCHLKTWFFLVLTVVAYTATAIAWTRECEQGTTPARADTETPAPEVITSIGNQEPGILVSSLSQDFKKGNPARASEEEPGNAAASPSRNFEQGTPARASEEEPGMPPKENHDKDLASIDTPFGTSFSFAATTNYTGSSSEDTTSVSSLSEANEHDYQPLQHLAPENIV